MMANPQSNQRSNFKWAVLTVGTLFGIAHIGILGHLINKTDIPIINLPVGDYTSYSVEAGKDGYSIQYSSNDPKVLGVRKSLDKKNGFFGIGGTTDLITEEEYTMDGARHLGGAVNSEGKLLAKREECIRADAGARSQGAMAGTAISAGVVVPAVASIPYVGWLASGWALLLGQKTGETIGSEVVSVFNDC